MSSDPVSKLFNFVFGIWILSALAVVGFWGFVIWAIYKLLVHFHVV